MEHSRQKQLIAGDINRPGRLTAAATWRGSPGKKQLYLNMVLWNEQFVTGSSAIDQQHKMLISHINHLEEMLTTTNPTREECDFLVHLVDFLGSYAATHFKFEEQCMKSYRCPAHARNKQAHGEFMKFINDFNGRFKTEGFRQETLKHLHATLDQWIAEHILQVDVQLKACLRG